MNRLVMVLLKNLWKLPGVYFKLKHYAKHTEEYPEAEKYGHVQYMLNHVVTSGNIDLVVSGQENIPQDEGFMFYANHQGMFDFIAIVATCDRPIAGVYKIELQPIPLIRYIAEATNSFAMDRDDVRQSLTVIQSVIQEVKKGRGYLIFPEGTRSKNGNVMGEFHGGSFRCATKSKCPIVPVALVDCYKVLDQKGSKPLTVQAHYLKPIPYEEYKDLKTTEIAALVRSRIEEKIQECS